MGSGRRGRLSGLTLHPHLAAAITERGVGSREPADPGDQARAVATHLPVIRITWGFGEKQVCSAGVDSLGAGLAGRL